MKNAQLILTVLLVLMQVFVSCRPKSQGNDTDPVSSETHPGVSDAQGFEIHKAGTQVRLLVLDPWNRSDTFAVYDFDTSEMDYKRWAVFSTTHIGFLDAIGEADRVVGCNTPDKIFHAGLRKKFREGNVLKIGSDMEYNLESVHQLHPDIMVQSAFPGQKTKDARLLTSDIEVLYLMEWLEPTPLGRAEWIKVFGLLLNKEAQADSIFESVKESYSALKNQITIATSKGPKVLVGNSFKGTWFMPGGENYQTRFLQDAGLDYPYLDSRDRGSLPLSFESVLHDFKDAGIWIHVSSDSYEELQKADERYALFSAFQNRQVYTFNQKMVEHANDYWESGVVNPHLVLKDLIAISHPDLFEDYQLVYYSPLK